MKNKSVLLVIDVQNDFLPGGSLAVKDGDKIIDIINKMLPSFDLVVFTQDWHPANHKSFASQYEDKNIFDIVDLNGTQQTLWPDHCIQNTKGAEITNSIDLSKIKDKFYIFKKGTDVEVDSYSGFYDNNKKNSTGLAEFLNEQEITDVFVCGLAFEFCVAFTAIDSANEGFNTIVIKDATKAISEDVSKTMYEFLDADVKMIESWELELYNVTK